MELHAVKSWYDLKRGRVIEVHDDVLNVVRDLRDISSRLHVFHNEQTDGFDVVESCLDGTDRLVCSAAVLDQRLVNRVREADHWHGRDRPEHIRNDNEDFAAQIDRDNEALEAEKNEAFRDKIRAVGEELHWALDIGPGQNSAGGKIFLGGKRHRTRYK